MTAPSSAHVGTRETPEGARQILKPLSRHREERARALPVAASQA